MLRRLVGDDYQYMRLGKQYFSTKQIRYLVHVPAVIRKAHNTSQGRKLMVPHNAFMDQDLNTSAAGSTTERKAEINANVLQHMENLDKLGVADCFITTQIRYYTTKPANGRLVSKLQSKKTTVKCEQTPCWTAHWVKHHC